MTNTNPSPNWHLWGSNCTYLAEKASSHKRASIESFIREQRDREKAHIRKSEPKRWRRTLWLSPFSWWFAHPTHRIPICFAVQESWNFSWNPIRFTSAQRPKSNVEDSATAGMSGLRKIVNTEPCYHGLIRSNLECEKVFLLVFMAALNNKDLLSFIWKWISNFCKRTVFQQFSHIWIERQCNSSIFKSRVFLRIQMVSR